MCVWRYISTAGRWPVSSRALRKHRCTHKLDRDRVRPSSLCFWAHRSSMPASCPSDSVVHRYLCAHTNLATLRLRANLSTSAHTTGVGAAAPGEPQKLRAYGPAMRPLRGICQPLRTRPALARLSAKTHRRHRANPHASPRSSPPRIPGRPLRPRACPVPPPPGYEAPLLWATPDISASAGRPAQPELFRVEPSGGRWSHDRPRP